MITEYAIMRALDSIFTSHDLELTAQNVAFLYGLIPERVEDEERLLREVMEEAITRNFEVTQVYEAIERGELAGLDPRVIRAYADLYIKLMRLLGLICRRLEEEYGSAFKVIISRQPR